MTWRTPAFFLSLIAGPFISVGAVTFYRRALEWWYVNQIAIERDTAAFLSWLVLAGLVLVALGSWMHKSIENVGWWWEKRP